MLSAITYALVYRATLSVRYNILPALHCVFVDHFKGDASKWRVNDVALSMLATGHLERSGKLTPCFQASAQHKACIDCSVALILSTAISTSLTASPGLGRWRFFQYLCDG